MKKPTPFLFRCQSLTVPSKAQPICQTTVLGSFGCTQTLQVLLQTSVVLDAVRELRYVPYYTIASNCRYFALLTVLLYVLNPTKTLLLWKTRTALPYSVNAGRLPAVGFKLQNKSKEQMSHGQKSSVRTNLFMAFCAQQGVKLKICRVQPVAMRLCIAMQVRKQQCCIFKRAENTVEGVHLDENGEDMSVKVTFTEPLCP